MMFSTTVLCLAAVLCSLAPSQGRAKSTNHLPKVDRVNHYEPLSYDTRPLVHKHDRIARGIIREPQIRNLQLQFSAFGRTFHLHLRPSRSVFSPGAKFKVNGQPSNAYDPASFYEGELIGDPSSHVTGHVINGVFTGVMRTPNGTYHIENSEKFFNNDNEIPFHSLIYNEKDVEFPHHAAGCGVNGTEWRQMSELQASAVPIKDHRILKRSRKMTDMFKKRPREKRALTSTGGVYCHMRVAVDHLFFSQVGGSDETATFAEVVTVFNLVQEIFRETDFDGDGSRDFITPSIESFEILTLDSPGYRFRDTSVSVNDFLNLWSQDDHTRFCLALLLTNRDFDDGVLGLAWVAQPPGGNRGGICEGLVRLSVGERSLNTAIVTFTNYGNRQPRAVSVVTIAHELGHNFGSPHDPSTSNCSPGSNGGGNYIMFPRATNGQRGNNNRFSPCSIDSIRDVLESSKSDCFSDEAFCGNGILEEGEECDTDPCCHTENCTLISGSECSSQQACCNPNCTLITDGRTCRDGTDCAEPAMCNAGSGDCPASEPVEGGNFLCNNRSNVCDGNGNCIGSYCLGFPRLSECQCTAEDGFSEDRFCDVCCVYEGECQTTFDLVNEVTNDPDLTGIEGQRLEPGRSCNNFEGYCSEKDNDISRCIVVDNERTLNDLLDLLSIDTLDEIVAWLTVYWWVAIIVIVAILVLFILLQVTYRKRQPLKRRLSRARNSFRRNSTSGGGQGQVRSDGVERGGGGGGGGGRGGGRGGRRRQREQQQRQISPDDAVRRLSAFFPTAETDTVRDIIRQSTSESKAVRRMLELGFPLKKIPIPSA